MRKAVPVVAVAVAAGWLPPLPVQAQDAPGIAFTLRGGARIAPDYFGSDSYSPGPALGFRLEQLTLPGGFTIGSPDSQRFRPGLSLGGSLRYIEARRPGEHPELTGMDKIDTALELGGSLRYGGDNWRAFADLRYGVVGHNAWTGELGVDVVLRPVEGLTLNAGPRAGFGDSRFARTYFGVTPAESAASGLAAFRPDGGLTSLGVELGARYDLGPSWGIEGTISYDRLQSDAARSPITGQGSATQMGVMIGLTRSFSFGF